MTKVQVTIHLTLQGKGGIGKSMVSTLVSQYLLDANKPLRCYDADPVNSTLDQHERLQAKPLDLLEHGNIAPRQFDGLMEELLTDTGSSAVIDCGASTFLPLTAYFAENEALSMLTAAGYRVLIHTVIVGGQAMTDTLNGLNTVIDSLPVEASVVVWLNEYYGPIEHEGKSFEDLKIYQKAKDRISAILHLRKQPSATFERDILDMMQSKRTFAEMIADSNTPIMMKQRLTLMQRDIYDELHLAFPA